MKWGMLVNPEFIHALNELNKKEMPAALAYKVGKITNQAADEQQTYFKLRKEVIEKYSVKDAEGKVQSVKKEDGKDYIDFGSNFEKVDEELKALAEQEVEFPTLSLSALDKAGMKFTVAQMNALKDLVIE